MAKVGVVLSGCGVFDGAEIHESVITLLALDRKNAEVTIMAPDVEQMHVLNHMTGDEMDEKRNVLIESARIARGNIKNMAEVKADEIDALIFPGGFGGAKNLSNFAVKGPEAEVNPEVSRLVNEMVAAKKPIGFICIMPAVASKIFANAGMVGVNLTIGSDPDTAGAMKALGANHIECPVTEIAVDKDAKIVSAPAYMLDASISKVAEGIEKLVSKVLSLI